MTTAATMVSQARTRAGLTKNALAKRAGVTGSTIARIECGEMDPTLTMLQRVLAGANRQLLVTTADVDDSPSVSHLVAAWPEAAVTDRRPSYPSVDPRISTSLNIDWTRLRSFIDWVHEHRSQTARAIASPPRRTTSSVFDNLLAGIAEKLADDANLPRPRWASAVPALDEPWSPPGTPRMVAYAHARTPSQLADRNVWVAQADLWRARV